MKHIMRLIGDRELAWIMLAIAGLVVWSTWGLIS
jgi:hypothetical protein